MPAYSAVQSIFSSTYSCLAGLAVGDPVYISAADTVAKCDGTDGGKMPCIGIVAAKPTTTTCVVQSAGEFTTTGLVAGSVYYVGAAGLTTSTVGLAVVQQIGMAKSTTVLVITPSVTVGGQNITGNLSVTANLTVGGTTALNDTVTILDGKNIVASANVTGNVLGGATDKWAFFGGTPAAQPANTVDARHALVTLGLIASGGNGIASASPVRVPLFDFRNNDYTVTDTTGGAGKFSLEGAVGTATFLQGEAAQNNTKTDIVLAEVVLPPDYIAAQDVTLTVNVQRVVAAGTTLTTKIDASAYLMADDGTAGADICATAEITFTETTGTDEAFTITGTTLTPGCRLLVKLTGTATEADNAGTVLVQINSVRVS